MRRRQGLAGLALAAAIIFGGGNSFAESARDTGQDSAPKCRKAEVNPVTGHVLCIDPLGAPVDLRRRPRSFPASLERAPTRRGATVRSAGLVDRELELFLDQSARLGDAVERDEGAEARALRLAEQHLVEGREPGAQRLEACSLPTAKTSVWISRRSSAPAGSAQAARRDRRAPRAPRSSGAR